MDTAPALVLLHGFTQTGRSWDGVVAALGERYRALAPDLRGHGSAADARPVDLAAIAADVLALAPERFTLGGYSMGGRIALALALGAAAPAGEAPAAAGGGADARAGAEPGAAAARRAAEAAQARIERLVLVGASPGLASAGERAARRVADEALAAELERDGLEAFAARWAALPLFAGQPPAVAAAAQAERLRQSPAGLAASLRGVGTGALPSLWERLGWLRVPVDLVVGERDGKFGAIAARMAQRIPSARVHVVPGAGHAVTLERPEAVAALL